MKKFIASFVVAIAASATTASAAYISAFNKTTNDGVYTLTSAQATMLGDSSADRIGFLRVRDGNGVNYSVGDTFDATSIFGSTNNDGKILAVLNGTNTDLSYTGGAFAALGTTTINNDVSGFYEGVAFLFDSALGNIVFNGTSTFNGAQTRGAFEGLTTPVPLPAALPMLLAGLGGLGVVARRRRKAS